MENEVGAVQAIDNVVDEGAGTLPDECKNGGLTFLCFAYEVIAFKTFTTEEHSETQLMDVLRG